VKELKNIQDSKQEVDAFLDEAHIMMQMKPHKVRLACYVMFDTEWCVECGAVVSNMYGPSVHRYISIHLNPVLFFRFSVCSIDQQTNVLKY
jgi:hypothetical protein